MARPWIEKELKQLRILCRKKAGAQDIARSLDRHVGSVRKKATELRLVLYKKVKAKEK